CSSLSQLNQHLMGKKHTKTLKMQMHKRNSGSEFSVSASESEYSHRIDPVFPDNEVVDRVQSPGSSVDTSVGNSEDPMSRLMELESTLNGLRLSSFSSLHSCYANTGSNSANSTDEASRTERTVVWSNAITLETPFCKHRDCIIERALLRIVEESKASCAHKVSYQERCTFRDDCDDLQTAAKVFLLYAYDPLTFDDFPNLTVFGSCCSRTIACLLFVITDKVHDCMFDTETVLAIDVGRRGRKPDSVVRLLPEKCKMKEKTPSETPSSSPQQDYLRLLLGLHTSPALSVALQDVGYLAFRISTYVIVEASRWYVAGGWLGLSIGNKMCRSTVHLIKSDGLGKRL
ncbi:hypothetical protein CLF_102282, partial [Clonorchis sinensis]